MKIFLFSVLMAFCAFQVAAQNIVLVPASVLNFGASPDHLATFGGTPVVTNYTIEFYLPTQVVSGVPSGAPVKIVNVGKPAPAGDGTITTTAIIPMLPALNVFYVGFATAVGPGGVGRSNAVGPFGAPGPPGAPTAAKTVP